MVLWFKTGHGRKRVFHRRVYFQLTHCILTDTGHERQPNSCAAGSSEGRWRIRRGLPGAAITVIAAGFLILEGALRKWVFRNGAYRTGGSFHRALA